MYLSNRIYDKAAEQLRAILRAYPQTDAAHKARLLMEQLPKRPASE